MIREIVTHNTPGGIAKLSTVCEPLEAPDTDAKKEAFAELMTDLLETAYHHALRGPRGCAGLAANQIGVCKRAFVMRFGGEFICVVNPVVLEQSDKTVMLKEGCLSFPGRDPVEMSRPKRIKVQYTCIKAGDVVTRKFKGIDARVFLHECDHLDGVLI